MEKVIEQLDNVIGFTHYRETRDLLDKHNLILEYDEFIDLLEEKKKFNS